MRHLLFVFICHWLCCCCKASAQTRFLAIKHDTTVTPTQLSRIYVYIDLTQDFSLFAKQMCDKMKAVFSAQYKVNCKCDSRDDFKFIDPIDSVLKQLAPEAILYLQKDGAASKQMLSQVRIIATLTLTATNKRIWSASLIAEEFALGRGLYGGYKNTTTPADIIRELYQKRVIK